MKLDTYTWSARLQPALITTLPIALAVITWLPEGFTGRALLIATLAYSGVSTLLAQLARDLGRAAEPALFRRWSGKPTTRALRHRDTHLDPPTISRYHAKLSALTGLAAPSAEEEARNPVTADYAYESFTRYLLESTRDKIAFPMIFAENISYGFRRNLWGMRTIGIALAAAGTLASGTALLRHTSALHPLAAFTILISLALLLLWAFRFTPRWVRLPADAFAVALVAATERLPTPR